MLDRLARHITGERAVTKLAQTVRQAFDMVGALVGV